MRKTLDLVSKIFWYRVKFTYLRFATPSCKCGGGGHNGANNVIPKYVELIEKFVLDMSDMYYLYIPALVLLQ